MSKEYGKMRLTEEEREWRLAMYDEAIFHLEGLSPVGDTQRNQIAQVIREITIQKNLFKRRRMSFY